MEKIQFWKDKKKRLLDPKLFSTYAERMAKELAEDHERSKKKVNKRTQLRKFYDEVLRLDSDTRMNREQDPEYWYRILPLVHMLTAKAAYAKGRNLVSENFLAFIKNSVRQVEDPEDLTVFANFFEALMGFYRQYGPSN